MCCFLQSVDFMHLNMYQPYWFHFLILLNFSWLYTTVAEYGRYTWMPKEIRGDCEGIETDGLVRADISKITKFNKTIYTYNATMHFKVPASDDMDLRYHFDKWGHNEWKKDSLVFESEKLCETLSYYCPQMYSYTLERFNLTGCPIPAGTYELVNFPMPEIGLSHVPQTFEYGKYRVRIELYDAKKVYGCAQFIIDIIPVIQNNLKNKG